MSTAVETPMFRQYLELKAAHPDAFLFFRMGDFYELFFDDAREAAPLLDLTLTSRNRNDPEPIPMCGVPRISVDGYIRKLVDGGHKVAIAEQVEDPRQARGLVERQVVRVVTPGVVLDPDGLDAREPNYLVGLVDGRGGAWGLAFLDVSTGDLRVSDVADLEQLRGELARLPAREAVLPADLEDAGILAPVLAGCLVNRVPRERFAPGPTRRVLLEVLRVRDLAGFGGEALGPGLQAAGALLEYARENSHSELRHVHRLRVHRPGGTLVMDEATRRNLELDRPLWGTGRRGTLLGLVDRTATAMGARLLREWLAFPLMDPVTITERLDRVEALVGDRATREGARQALREVADVERIGSKVTQGTANARDLVALRRSLEALPGLAHLLATLPPLAAILPEDRCGDVAADIGRILVDDPPFVLNEGNLVRPGVDPDLDELVRLARSGKGAIAEMEQRERQATAIGSLRIRHHKTQGYFIEVTQSNLGKVPDHYRRWQTLTNCERYITPELKEFEDKVLTADSRRISREYDLFCALRDRVAEALPRLQAMAGSLAVLDVLAALADLAVQQRYTRPLVDTSDELDLEDARHPVVETLVTDEPFVPNSLRLEPDQRRMVILTGPNMSGKSTIMRQVALVVLLAQVGSFVPARRARVGVCDRIFVRVGASDDLSRGRSTFMVEMAETANILHNATRRSLVLLDEIGRGTSTYDGLAIAWSVAEALHDRIRCRTLFATHYHELATFGRRHPRAVNMQVAVSEHGERIIFLRRLKDGSTSRSYGIQCARLAGMPEGVVGRARGLLRELELQRPKDDRQLSLFDAEAGAGEDDAGDRALPPPEGDLLRDALRVLEPDGLSPREALETLYRLKAMV